MLVPETPQQCTSLNYEPSPALINMKRVLASLSEPEYTFQPKCVEKYCLSDADSFEDLLQNDYSISLQEDPFCITGSESSLKRPVYIHVDTSGLESKKGRNIHDLLNVQVDRAAFGQKISKLWRRECKWVFYL